MTITIRITINRRSILALATVLVLIAVFISSWHAADASGDAAATKCPKLAEPRISQAAVLRLEHGYMVWIGDKRLMYVMYYDPGSTTEGEVEIYPETWEEGMPPTDPSIVPPNGLAQPDRGIGLVWRTQPGVKDRIGYGLSGSTGYMAVIQIEGNKTWFNGIDDAFYIEGKHWKELYAWRHS